MAVKAGGTHTTGFERVADDTLKGWTISTRLQGATSQQSVIFTFVAVRTSNLYK
jgi:hypothetical protein